MPSITTQAGPWNMTVYAFDETDPENPLFRAGADEVARLPFGALELDRDGKVVAYNDTEPDDGGPARQPLVGRDFFGDVARWAGTSLLAQQFRSGVETGTLNVVFDCAVPRLSHKVRIHLKVSPILGTFWVFIKKLARSAE
jgi:photoactive yellow protein